MTASEFEAALGPDLSRALARRGYAELTAVQQAVLDPSLDGRDLRITSQTGSGKTLAIGFAIRELALGDSPSERGIARPRAIVVAPTRELARQVEEELTWLYAERPGRVASVTGGANYREEHRALARGPAVIVGTPGRLLDHLERGAIDGTPVGAVVLDEADRLLDLGFRDELDAIFDKLPEARRTHLVSATFPKDVRALADRVQKDAAHVEGTRLGAANADIDHVVHVVDTRQKVDALVNLLLADPEAQTLAFARTRKDVAEIADRLAEAGFAASSLSGEMDQAARNRALAAFKRGDLRVLVATDVAARGIDVPDIARVIHVDVPTDVDTYVHRSGRTGRAGRRGTSSLLVAPSGREQAGRLLRRAGLMARFEPIPTAADIRRAIDDRVYQELTADPAEHSPALDPRTVALAERLVEAGDPARTIARLLGRVRGGGIEPREVRALPAHGSAGKERAVRDRGPAPRGARPAEGGGSYVPFRVTWGERHGADPRRLMALVCRRGDIRGADVGAIRVESSFSIVEVSAAVAQEFAAAAGRPDPRDPRVFIVRDEGAPPRATEGRPPRERPRHDAPPRNAEGHAPRAPRERPRHDAPPRDAEGHAPRAPRERARHDAAHPPKRPHARPAPRQAPAQGHAPPRRKKR